MLGKLVTRAGLALALACGWVIGPEVWHATQVFAVADDAAARVDTLLQEEVSASQLAATLDEALAGEDEGLAASLIEVADEQKYPVTAQQRTKLAALGEGSAWRSLRDFGGGFAYGNSQSGAAFSGALVGDVTGYGDLRDLYQEGSKLAAGQSADTLVIGLAAAGLAVSAATWTSVGAALPARSGMTLVKTAQKAGRLSKPLMATLSRAATAAIDRTALAQAVAATGRLELTAAWHSARTVLRPSTLTTFRNLGQDAATLYGRTGQRGARQVLAMAESSAEVSQAAKIAVVKGSKTRAILALLGRGALVAVAISLTAAGWIMSALWYVFGLALLARRFGNWLGRKLRWPRRRAAPLHFPAAPRNAPPLAAPARAAVAPARAAVRSFERPPRITPQDLSIARRRRGRALAQRSSFPGITNDKPLLGR